MSLTDDLEIKVLDHIFNGVAYTPPAHIYVGLFTAAPSDTGGGTELSGHAYARQEVTFAAAASGAVASDAAVTFPAATADWGDITHSALFDAATAGNMLMWGALTTPRNVADSEIFMFPIGSIRVTLD
jgi:hypothetical protein